MFLIYTNDLPLICSNSDVSLFADDTSVYNMNKNSESEITKDIQVMTAWFNKYKLTVKNDRCDTIGFRDAKPVNEIAFSVKVAHAKI